MARNITPGYCVVERPGSLEFQARELFRDTRSPAASLFMKLNSDTPWLKPGQILIVADPDAPATTQTLNILRQEKQRTNAVLFSVSAEEASFLQKNYGMIAGLTSAGDKIFGITGDMGEKYFSSIEDTLRKIEASYQNQYLSQGTLISQPFFVERNQLLDQLKTLVNKPLVTSLAHHSVKLRPYENMRKALNLSSRSIVHEWSTAGLGGIPGYSKYISHAAKAGRFLKYGGYIGIGFSFANTSNHVVNICTTGRGQECKKVAFKEYTKFGVGTVAAIGSGYLGSSAGMGVCVAVGIATAGFGGVACAAVGAAIGGYIGSNASQSFIDIIME